MEEGTVRKVSPEMLQRLPEPVQRYMNFTGVLGKPWIHSARLRQTGRFRLGVDRPWMPMRAQQTFHTHPPAFTWDAHFKLFGLPLLRARDRYASGHGHMYGKIARIFTVFDARGEELDQGTMMRYLSEMIWFPIAYLGENIRWEAVDDESARVTFTDGGRSVSGQMYFDAEGRPINFTAMRYYEKQGRYTLEAWSTPITDYAERSGLNLPVRGRAMWHLDSGAFPYVDLEIGTVEYKYGEIRS
jgi:hypothetical protein